MGFLQILGQRSLRVISAAFFVLAVPAAPTHAQTQEEVDAAERGAKFHKANKESFEAQKAMLDSVKGPSGKISGDGLGALSVVAAVRTLSKAGSLEAICKELTAGSVVYDQAVENALLGARLVKKLTEYHTTSLKSAAKSLATPPDASAAIASTATAAGVLLAINAVSTLASMLRSDVTATATKVEDANRYVASALVAQCPNKPKIPLATGSVDLKKVKELLEEVDTLRNAVGSVEKQLADIEERAKDKNNKNPLPIVDKRQEAVRAVAAAKRFIEALSPDSLSPTAPLVTAARWLELEPTLEKADRLDLHVRLESIALVRDRFFHGQNLNYTAALIIDARVHDHKGNLKKVFTVARAIRPTSVSLSEAGRDDTIFEDTESSK